MFKRSAHMQLGVILAVFGVTAGAIMLSQPNTATAEVVVLTKITSPSLSQMPLAETIRAAVRHSAKKSSPSQPRLVASELERLRRAAMFGADPLSPQALTLHIAYDADRQEARVRFVVRTSSHRAASAVADFHARTFEAYWRDTSRAKYELGLAYLRERRNELAADHKRSLEDLARFRRAGPSSEIASAETRVAVVTANLAQLTKRLAEASQNQPWQDAAKQVTFASSPRPTNERGAP